TSLESIEIFTGARSPAPNGLKDGPLQGGRKEYGQTPTDKCVHFPSAFLLDSGIPDSAFCILPSLLSMPADSTAIVRRRKSHFLLKRFGEMKHVAKTKCVSYLFKRIVSMINRRAGPFKTPAFLIAPGRLARELHESLPKVFVVQPDLRRYFLRSQPAGGT